MKTSSIRLKRLAQSFNYHGFWGTIAIYFSLFLINRHLRNNIKIAGFKEKIFLRLGDSDVAVFQLRICI